MDQQATRLAAAGLRAVALHAGLAGLPYYRTVGSLFMALTQFLFVSPERLRFDGYLNYVLRRNRDRIGLVVVDEAHCISQWGEAFRPAYRSIPAFIRSVFGSLNTVPLLGLTATLSTDDQQQICADFDLPPTSIQRSAFLLRKNLNLSFETLENETAKLARLGTLLEDHRGQKMIVYVHRISSDYGTRAMAERFTGSGFACRSFDSRMGAAEKREVLLGFECGSIPVVFATAAFGMGIDISDIRGVIHYLTPGVLRTVLPGGWTSEPRWKACVWAPTFLGNEYPGSARPPEAQFPAAGRDPRLLRKEDRSRTASNRLHTDQSLART